MLANCNELICTYIGGFENINLFFFCGTDLSRRNSIDMGDHNRESEFVVFKERKLVPLEPVRLGMGRLSFLLETCQPGSVPDSQLLAASLDLVRYCHCLEFCERICTYSFHLYFHVFVGVSAPRAGGRSGRPPFRMRLFCTLL